MTATQLYRNRIAIVFDFDLTLAPDSFSTLLRHCGIEDPDGWRERHVQPLVDQGWETILARIYSLVRFSRSNGSRCRITTEVVREAGRSIVPFEGVPEMFATLRRLAAQTVEGLEVKFHLVTSGFADLHRAVSFAGEFSSIWGTEFHFDDEGGMAFAKRVITHPEKARYILALSKDMDPKGPNGPADVYRDVPDGQVHLPLDQIIYVGDGGSDMAAFGLLHDHGGIALAVYKAERPQDWRGQAQTHADRRVQNLAPPDFRPESELMRSLGLAVESIAKKVALRRLGAGE